MEGSILKPAPVGSGAVAPLPRLVIGAHCHDTQECVATPPYISPPPTCEEVSNLPDVLLALSDPKLNTKDRMLLFAFTTSKTGEISPELAKRFAQHYQNIGAIYHGWEGNQYYSESDAFLGVLAEYFGPYDFERFQAHLMRKDIFAFIIHLDADEVEMYRAMDAVEFWQRYKELTDNFTRTAPGTMQKILLFRQVRDLEAVALARGFSLEDHSFSELCAAIPGLTEQEYIALRRIEFYSKYAKGNANSVYTQQFRSLFNDFAGAYLEAESAQKPIYAAALLMLDRLAPEYGLSKRELDQMLEEACKKIGCSLLGSSFVEDMEALSANGSIDVSPEGLPQEVKEILDRTGYWHLVKENLYLIHLTPEIKEGSSSSLIDAIGRAYPFLKMVEIDFIKPDGNMVPAWEIAATLVHEAAHVAWRKQEVLLQQATPDERQAFATEHWFLRSYKTIFGKPMDRKGESQAFDLAMVQSKSAVKTANLILRTAAKMEELDLSYYPTNPPPGFLEDRAEFENLAKRLDLTNPGLINLLWKVLNGTLSLEITANGAGQSIDGIPVVFVVSGTEKTTLSREEVLQLAQFFTIASNLLFPEQETTDPYVDLVRWGDRRSVRMPLTSKSRVLSALGGSRIINYDELQKGVVGEGAEYNVEMIRPAVERELPDFIATIRKVLSSPKISSSYNLEDLLSSLDIARDIIAHPNTIRDYQKLAYSRELQKSDRERIRIALQIYRQLQKKGVSQEERLGLIDFASAYVWQTLNEGRSTITTVYSAATLREMLHNVSLALSADEGL